MQSVFRAASLHRAFATGQSLLRSISPRQIGSSYRLHRDAERLVRQFFQARGTTAAYSSPVLVIRGRASVVSRLEQLGDGATIHRLFVRMTEGFSGLGPVYIRSECGSLIEVALHNRAGRLVAKRLLAPENFGKGSELPTRCLITGMEVAPAFRGRGIGMRLFGNTIRFLSECGEVRYATFQAAKLGGPVWARFGGVQIEGESLLKIRMTLHRLAREHRLSISPDTIERLNGLEEILALRLHDKPPRSLVDRVTEIYSSHHSEVSPTRIEEMGREIGRIALLEAGFKATIDVCPASSAYRQFEHSFRRLVGSVTEI